MKTFEDIVSRIPTDPEDVLCFKAEVLLRFLPFEAARPLVKADFQEKNWPEPLPLTEDMVLEQMRKYMEFAWCKVINHRGLSAGRSVQKMEAWLWLIESDLDLGPIQYENYGAPKLAAVCKRYGFPIPDNPLVANMILGRPCREGCDEGCGR